MSYKKISIFYQIQNIQDFQIWFQLWKSRIYHIAWIDIVQVLHVFFDNIQIWSSCNFVSCNNNTFIIQFNKVDGHFRFNILKWPVDISDMNVWSSHYSFNIVRTYKNDYIWISKILWNRSLGNVFLILIILLIFLFEVSYAKSTQPRVYISTVILPYQHLIYKPTFYSGHFFHNSPL